MASLKLNVIKTGSHAQKHFLKQNHSSGLIQEALVKFTFILSHLSLKHRDVSAAHIWSAGGRESLFIHFKNAHSHLPCTNNYTPLHSLLHIPTSLTSLIWTSVTFCTACVRFAHLNWMDESTPTSRSFLFHLLQYIYPLQYKKVTLNVTLTDHLEYQAKKNHYLFNQTQMFIQLSLHLSCIMIWKSYWANTNRMSLAHVEFDLLCYHGGGVCFRFPRRENHTRQTMIWRRWWSFFFQNAVFVKCVTSTWNLD